MILLIAALLFQGPTGVLGGVVADHSGSTIPGAQITITTASGETRTVITNSRGEYVFEALPAGRYLVTARLIGFRSDRSEVRVAAGGAARWNATLEVPFTPSVPEETPSSGPDPTSPELARELYALIVSYVRRRPAPIAIHEKSFPPPLRTVDDLLTEFGSMWDEMRKAVTADTHARPVTLSPKSLPAGAAFRPDKEIFDIHLTGKGTLESIRLSKVLLAPDGQAAVVAYWYSCGNLCGNGTLAFFRKRPDGRWSIAVQRTYLVS